MPYCRWACLIALLLGEIVGLTVFFDGALIAREWGLWSTVLRGRRNLRGWRSPRR